MIILRDRSKTESRFYFAWGGAVLKISFPFFWRFVIGCMVASLRMVALLRFASLVTLLRFLPSLPSFAYPIAFALLRFFIASLRFAITYM
jgi:hypothetical protein